MGRQKLEGNARSRASAAWAKREGLTIKSFKLSAELTQDFTDTCEALEIPQAKVIHNYMIYFCNKYGDGTEAKKFKLNLGNKV